jgi:hypothetical protein
MRTLLISDSFGCRCEDVVKSQGMNMEQDGSGSSETAKSSPDDE